MTVGALAAGVTMVAHIPVLIGTTQVLLSICFTRYCSYITCISFNLHCEHLRTVYIFKYPGFYLEKKKKIYSISSIISIPKHYFARARTVLKSPGSFGEF